MPARTRQTCGPARDSGVVLAEREEQVDETLGGRLRLMVGQADALVGFDEHIVGLVHGRHQQVEPDHRNVQRPRGAHGRLDQLGMQLGGDVFQRAASMQVGGAAHGQALPLLEHAVQVEPGVAQAAAGFLVQRDTAFAAGGGLAPAALGFDQCADAVCARRQ